MFKSKVLPVFWCFVLVCLLSVNSVSARDIIRVVEGKVTKVSDGDTVQVITSDGTKLKIRLAGVDCPETQKINKKTGKINKQGQPYGDEAQKFTESLVNGEEVQVDIYGIDQYQRVLAYVFTSDGRNLNLELVAAGLAEVYVGGEYGPYKRELEALEKDARKTKTGMWNLDKRYESPKEFRKRLKVSGE